ncbi:MAG: glycoside hydrolase family 2 protein [Gemmatimonadota bacterium]
MGPDSLDGHPDYDRFDWWYRCTFEHAASSASRHELRFDGLATLAEVWLNGSKILDSANMFVTHSVDVTDHLEDTNELWIAFRSLTQHLAGRRPRPRWKTKLVGEQKLRWVRTTLLGRIPGWTPQVLTVGPWRDVSLAAIGDRVRDIAVEASVKDGVPRVSIRASLSGTPDECVLVVGDAEFALEVENGRTLDAHVDLPDAELWWPHTHGEPTLHPLRLRVRLDGETVDSDLGRVGFRTVTVDRTGGREQLVVNDVPVFARGACWTSNDVISLVGAPDEMRETLERAVGANANMVRVGGTMVYETESFYDACDELGLMVWQDFMFANMDYPVDDPDFSDSIMHEAGQQATRLARHASVVCFCGGSEVEQQAAMFGAPREVWTNDFFSNRLPELVADVAHVPYWPSTPTGGVLPFHVGEGLGHYYGVGAYRRPLEDARLSAVKFSPECLGFSNIPERGALRELGHDAAPHTPVWKAGVARDSSAGWDFEDIRDHYMRVLFGVDPVELRATDLDRYIRLGRVTTGRVMARVFDEWRSPEHPCAGGLVWFLKDLRPGAGWGLIDSGNRAKPALHYMRRAWAPRRVTLLDRGLDGVRVEVHNEPDEPLTGTLELTIYGLGSEVLATTTLEVRVEARSTEAWSLEEELGRFLDPNWAYRFGPLRHAAIAATLSTDDSESSTVLWPKLAASLPAAEIEAEIDASRGSVHSATLARDVALDLKGGEALDNYFDLLPGRPKTFSVDSDGERPSGYAEAENLPDGVRIRTPE